MKKTYRWKKVSTGILAAVLLASTLVGCGTTTGGNIAADSAASPSANETASSANEIATPANEIASPDNETETKAEAVISVAIGADPSSFDPAISLGGALMYIFGLTQESLTRFGDDQQLVDGLADKIEHNEDFTEWTFTLRDSGWNNGDSVTADDWVYGIGRLVDGTTDVAFPDFVYEIKNARAIFAKEADASTLGVTAVDEKTVKFTLEYPVPYFEKLLTHCQHFGVNRSFVASIGGDVNYGTTAQTSLGNGPYYVDSWKTDNVVVLKKNPYYWNKDNIAVDQVNVYIIPDESTQVNMFINGELDIVDFSAQRLSTIKSAGFDAQSYNNGRTAYLSYNFTNPYFVNKYIRQAISSAIDRDSLVAGVLKNDSKVADGFVPPGLSGADSTFRDIVGGTLEYAYNPERSRELLKNGTDELGINAADINFTLLTSNTDEFKSIAGALQQLLQNELGITVNIETLDSGSVYAKRSSGDYDVYLTSWGADYDDATNFLGSYEHGDEAADYLYKSEEFNTVYKAAVYTLDQKERIAQLGESEKILLEDQGITTLYYTAQYYAVSDRASGVIRRAVVPYLDTYFVSVND
ncbi:MAG: peptide ABC transporter substrate-binding protein [Clostridiales bacterium]|jgi:ABC-type oligopeptide transport system substrate-binding subunit|nr:peptide ABC transporter substrate-binding protein [Clostridiales bacterium]